MSVMEFWARFGEWAAGHGPRVLLALAGGYLARRTLRSLTKRLDAYDPATDQLLRNWDPQRLKTLTQLIHYVGNALTMFVVGVIVLAEVGVNPSAILASAGVVGVAVGFGAQTLIKDLLAGVFILVENQFQVGDIIRTGEKAGQVEKMTLRITCIRDLSGNYHVIPNGELSTVTNLSKEWSRAVVDVDVAYKEDIDRCLAVIEKTAGQWVLQNEALVVDKPEMLGVQALGPHGVTLRMILKTKPLEKWNTERALRKAIKAAFDEAGIEIPFQQVTVWQAERPLSVPRA